MGEQLGRAVVLSGVENRDSVEIRSLIAAKIDDVWEM